MGSWKKKDFVLELLSQDCGNLFLLFLLYPLALDKSELRSSSLHTFLFCFIFFLISGFYISRDLLIRNVSNPRVPQLMAAWSFSFEDVVEDDFEVFAQVFFISFLCSTSFVNFFFF